MNMNIDLTQVVVALIGLLSAFITYRLIPWIKANTDVKQQMMIRAAVQTAVFAAEQIYGAGEGAKKFDYVVNWLKEKGYDVGKTEIEGAVYELLKQAGVVITPTKVEQAIEK